MTALIVIVGGVAIAIDVATIPSGEGPLIAGGLRHCLRNLCQSKVERDAAQKAADHVAKELKKQLTDHKQKLAV